MLGDPEGADVRRRRSSAGRPAGDAGQGRIRATALAAGAGAVLLGLKYSAYQLTGSVAILSDTLESIVTLTGALFALTAFVAGRSPERGDGAEAEKAESFRAVFKGGMLALAGVMVVTAAGEALLFGHVVRQLDYGVLITVGCGIASAALGWFLLRAGRRHGSAALLADGTYALADFWTSVATAIALGLVRATGVDWLDPTVAMMIGVSLLWTGLYLAAQAASGLLEQDDTDLLERLLQAMNTHLVPGVIRVHALRALRSGRRTWVEARIVVPEFWTVEEAHDFSAAFKHRVADALGGGVEMQWQIVPCRRQHCASCEVHPCPIRVQPFSGRGWITLDEAQRSEPLGQ